MTNAPIAVVTHRDDPNRVHDLADGPPDPTALRAAAVVVVAAVTLTAEQEEELAALTAAGARLRAGAGRVPDWRRCAGGCGTSSPPSSGATGAAR